MMIKQLLAILSLLLVPLILTSQNNATFIVHDLSEVKRDSIFIVGSFNNWVPSRNEKYLLHENEPGIKSIVLDLPPGEIQYKYTGGGWDRVEKQWGGLERNNRVIDIHRDTIVTDTVWKWRDLLMQSFHLALRMATDDTSRISSLNTLASVFIWNSDHTNADSAQYYIQASMQTLQRIKGSNPGISWPTYDAWLFNIQALHASILHGMGNYSGSQKIRLENLRIAEQSNDPYSIVFVMMGIVENYIHMKDYNNVRLYAKKMQETLTGADRSNSAYCFSSTNASYYLGFAYHWLHEPDSALFYGILAHQQALGSENDPTLTLTSTLLGDIYADMGKSDSAFHYYRVAIPYSAPDFVIHIAANARMGIAKLFQKQGEIDSALYYARYALNSLINNKTLVQSWSESADPYIVEISPLVADLYKDKNQLDSAYKFLHLSVELRDSLYNVDKVRLFQNLTFDESLRLQQIEQQKAAARKDLNTKIKLYGLLIGLTAFLIIAFVLYRNNRRKQKINAVLHQQKLEIEKTLSRLQETQKQLIQSEKMASLGELTAGIAHEIQNPLNFVNNFSEVNKELIEEMQEELKAGKTNEAIALSNDIRENQEKINHHGKRADAIVKGMLQHSRASSGVKEPTDINALADEYLRLAYHGLRAKDKSFNATMKTDFDPTVGMINVVPQDIGRVILNLITNAFYACNERVKQSAIHSQQSTANSQQLTANSPLYQPTVIVTSKNLGNKIEIRVKDNGNGIPQHISDKIFQPFFTTKPTGQGTGLGLSLSYDIVKAHGGELKVESNEGEGSEFIIHLPIA